MPRPSVLLGAASLLFAGLWACGEGHTVTAIASREAGGDAGAEVAADAEPPADASSDGGPVEAMYYGCFDMNGSLLPALKACEASSDCVSVAIPACCGGGELLGLNAAFLSAFTTCQKNAPPCGDLGCAGSWEYIDGAVIQNPFSTEDGRVYSQMQGSGTAQVECSSADAGPRLCHTYLP